MTLEMISPTATPEMGNDYGSIKPKRFIEGRRETTTPLMINIALKTFYCVADNSCGHIFVYDKAESLRQEEIIKAYRLIQDTNPVKGLNLIEDKYVISQKSEIDAFLDENPALNYVLMETHERIWEIFNDNIIEIALSINKDPEEDYTGLSVTVRTSLKTDQSLVMLDKFDEEYWLDIDAEIRNAITVMVRSA